MTDRGDAIPPRRRRALDALGLLSKKWHPVVVVVLDYRGPLGFNELLDAIPDVSGKVLSGALEALQEAGLVERQVLSESPLRVEYRLTEAGADMTAVFDALAGWGSRHLDSTTPTVLLADGDRRITDMYREWLADRYALVRTHDGEELAARLDARVDVVLLDVGLPGADAGAVVAAHGEDCRTILLVGERPSFDLLAVDCDDLRRKPLVRETALDAVDAQVSAQGESTDRRLLGSLSARQSLFESVYGPDRLEASAAYRSVCSRREALADRLGVSESGG